jgi:hypothetical protein
MAIGDNLYGEQRNAFDALNNVFSSFGLGSLAPKIFEFIQNGYSADTIQVLLQDTPEYKQRFAGNELRRQRGLPVLAPNEYLSVESSYRQLMRQAGLPEGFYDQASDFNDFIGKDMSPTELKSRVDLASQAATLANTAYKDALERMYGVDQSHVTAYFLDQDKALPLLQKQAAAAAIGAEALKRNLELSQNLEEYATAGITAQQAAQAYTQIAQDLPKYQTIAAQYGEKTNQHEFEHAILETGTTGVPQYYQENPSAKFERLQSWQRARSKGEAGAAAQGLSRSTSGRV